jgi:molybdate transport system substrate-binding protein
MYARRAVAIGLGLVLAATTAWAADLKVLSTIGAKGVLDELVPQFERDSGHKVAVQFATGAMLKKQIDAGETFDVAILTPPQAIDDLVREGKLAADSRAEFARTRVGVAVPAGMPKPDIATVDAFKQALRAAKAIGHTDPAFGGTSGVHMKAVIERLGMADELAAKTKLAAGPPALADMVARREVDLAVMQLSEIVPDRRLELVGAMPPGLERSSSITLAVHADAKEAAAARAFARFLVTPAAHKVLATKGMDAP